MARKSSRLRWLLGGMAAFLMSALISLLAVEVFVRVTWANQPATIYPNDTGCCAAGTLRPGITGHDFYHQFRHNSRGYRGPEYAREHPGRLRVAVVGDSFVYGVGVTEENSIPGVLQDRLRQSIPDAEVINAGVPGANLEWDIKRVRAVARDYKPDVVVLVMLYNDLELGSSAINTAPQVETMRVTTESHRDRLGELSELMLPRVRPGEARFGPGTTPSRSIALRYAIARLWRTYLYVALELGRVGTSWKQIDRHLTLLHVESRQNDEIIWGRLRRSLEELQEIGRQEDFRVGLVLFQEGPLEGIPTLKLRDAFQSSGITWLDLAPLWGSFENFIRNYSFRFDMHPNRKTNRMASEALDAWLAGLGWLPTPANAEQKQWMKSYQQRVGEYRVEQEKIAAGQRQVLESRQASFSSSLVGEEDSDEVRQAQADQWLYGWYRSGPGGSGSGPRGRYMGRSGGFFLRAGEGAADTSAAGKSAADRPAADRPAADTLRVEASRLDREGASPLALQAACNGTTLGPPQTPTGRTFEARFPLPAPVAAGTVLECVLTASGAIGATTAGGSNRPPSEASFAIIKVALESSQGGSPGARP